MIHVPTGLLRCLLQQQILQALLLLFLQVLLLYRLYCCLTLLTEAATPDLSSAVHTQLVCQPLQLLQQQPVVLLLLPSQCLAEHLCL
jgi:hypothetical protein